MPDELVGRGAPDMRYECARIAVPRDWGTGGGATTGPGAGETFEIALLRARSTKQRDRIGSLVINPGGPGGSGVDTAVYLSFGPRSAGCPPRSPSASTSSASTRAGSARSSPVKCISDADLDASFGFDPDPASQADVRRTASALNQRIGRRLRRPSTATSSPLYGTEQAARDMDAVRAAVGDEKLTYLGYSYGTLLGATYAQLFPQRVRALVLDGAVDPQQRLGRRLGEPGQGLRTGLRQLHPLVRGERRPLPDRAGRPRRRSPRRSTRPRSPRCAAPTAGRPPPAGSSTR